MKAGREQTSEAKGAAAHGRLARRGGEEVPEVLCRRFEKFRQQSVPRTRVPQALRRAVLDAVERGVSMQAVRRELGLTHQQVWSWQREVSRVAKGGSAVNGPPSARAFDVIDAPGNGETATADDTVVVGEALELRLGGWSLVIRATSGR